MIETLELPKVTTFTNTDRIVLAQTVHQARSAGFVRDDQENEVGIVCFGAAICEGPNRPVASVSVSVPLFRLSADTARYSAPLLDTVAKISAQLGFMDQACPP